MRKKIPGQRTVVLSNLVILLIAPRKPGCLSSYTDVNIEELRRSNRDMVTFQKNMGDDSFSLTKASLLMREHEKCPLFIPHPSTY